jgi:outer membrane protein assembly factor BamB
MDRDTITRSTAQALVAGGAVLTVAALLGPVTWRQGEAHGKPAFAVLLTILLLGPALSTLCAVTTRLRPTYLAAGVAGAGALVAAVAAALAAAPEATRDGLAPGGPLAAVAGVATAGGWLIAALTHRIQGRVSWGPLAAATVVVVLLGWLGPAGAAAIARAGVDAREVPAVPLGAAAAPAGLDERWRASVPGTAVDVAAGLVLVRDRAGIRTVDARTGKPAWHHVRAGWSLLGVGAAAGGRVVVGVWRADGEQRAIGFDASTGARRWERVVKSSTVDHRVVGSGDVVVLVPRAGTGGAVALSASTGRLRWTWKPANPSCVTVTAAASAQPSRDEVIAIAFACPDGRRVAGVSIVGADVRWTWAPATADEGVEAPPRGTAPGGTVPGGFAPLLVGTSGGLLVNDGATGVVLGMATGRSGGIHPAGGRLAAAVGSTALYLGAGGAVGVDLALGRERWRTPLPGATTAVAVTGAGGAGFGLVVPDRGGPARVLRYDVGTGAVGAERQVDDATTALWLGPGVVVLADTKAGLIGLG